MVRDLDFRRASDGAGRRELIVNDRTQHSEADFERFVHCFVRQVPGVAHAVVVSSDGVLLSKSSRLSDEGAGQLASITSGLISLADAAARCLEGGKLVQTLIEMKHGLVLVMSISDGSSLAVLVAPNSDVGLVAYETTLLVDRLGLILTPHRHV